MKKLFIIFALIASISCSDDDVEPYSPECKQNAEAYTILHMQIERYRVTPGADRGILADMRKQLQVLLDYKNKNCK